MNGLQTSTDPGGATLADWSHWDLVLGLGTEMLPVVCDAAAKPTPGSKVPKFGKVPSEYAPDGCARGIAGWQSRAVTPADIERWSADRRYSLGVRCHAVRAFDCDITDATVAERIATFIAGRLGTLPKRMRGNASKFLLAFRFAGALKKRKIETASGSIELLADGQQFVAAGRHPSGAQYEWAGGLPTEMPTIGVDALESLWTGLTAEFGVKPDRTEQHTSEALPTITADQLADLQSALTHPALLEAAGSNDTWAAIGYALLSLGEQGRGLWLEFSDKAANPNPGSQTGETWWVAHAMQAPRSDFLHVFNLASQLGWANPQAGKVAKPEDFPLENPDVAGADTKRARFTPLDFHTFAQRAPLEYIVEGILPRAGLGLIFGAPSSGKTFFALDLMFAVARGVPWRERPVKQASVVYVAAEGAAGCQKRFLAYAQANDVQLKDIPGAVFADSPNLLNTPEAKDLIAAIQPLKPSVVVIDTLSAVSPGGNENSSEDVGRVLAHCKTLHQVTGALVILIHHTGKDEARGPRGWSGIQGALDVGIEVTRDGENRCARISKMKDDEDNATFPFRLLPVQLAFADKPTTSCVIEHTDAPQGISDDRNAPRGVNEKLALNVAAELVPPALGVGVAVGALIDAMVLRMSHDDRNGKRDRRREHAKRAIETLATSGHLECRDNTLHFPRGVDDTTPSINILPEAPGDAQSRMFAAIATKPESPKNETELPAPKPRTRKAQTGTKTTEPAPTTDCADLLGEAPAPLVVEVREPAAPPIAELPEPAPREPQPFVLAATESRDPQAAKLIDRLHKLGHESATRIEPSGIEDLLG